MHTETYRQLDRDHHLHPFTDFKALGEEGSRIVTHAEGVYIHDSEGNRILDAMAGLWCVNMGYGREELVAAATAQLRELPYYNNFFKSTHPPAVKLAEMLCRLAPAHMNRVFFTGSGSEANDTYCAWCAATGPWKASPTSNGSSPARMPTTVPPWPA